MFELSIYIIRRSLTIINKKILYENEKRKVKFHSPINLSIKIEKTIKRASIV